ncbi:hypothetical protein B0G84_9051 [Paraburkholderia sp. BL8N3]|nr:hypothetical protein [Paraburkholderia sp. BL8N3]TCK31936.1 hypothetical protein B0G84_9051 [Paraburkholderia sp. BL8N3]
MIDFLERSKAPGALRGISVRVLPGLDAVQMSRAAALHLYMLLQRYNWCLSSANDYRARWAEFWPARKPVERALLVLFVTANNGGEFGRRMVAVDAPLEFEAFELLPNVAPASPVVAREFDALLALHYSRLADQADICDWLRRRCPKEFALLVSIGGLSPAFRNGRLDPEHVRQSSRARFIECGWDTKGASALATAIFRHLMWFYKTKEAALC